MMETKEVTFPFGQTMPYWDGLLDGGWGYDEYPNYHIMENMHMWCDVQTHSTYVVYEQYGGFFGGPTQIVVGDLEKEVVSDSEKVSLCGYLWTEEGVTYTMDNTKDIPDGMNEGWCDLDDWIYEPFWGDGFRPDGTKEPPTPPGMCRVMGTREDGTFGVVDYRPIPDRLDIEKNLMNAGFERVRRPGNTVDELENLLEKE